VLPERGADNPAVLDMPNVKVKIEAQHSIPSESSLFVTGNFYIYYYYYYYYYSIVKKGVFPIHAMKAYRSVEVQLHSFLTLLLDGDELLAPVALLPGKNSSTH
jgi:hypothetical protein